MSRSKVDLILRIAMCALVVAFIVVATGTLRERVVKAGDTAPDFSITTDHGRRITPSDFGGKALVLHFWASWCPPCVEETPALNAFARKMAGSGVVVVAISVDKNPAAYKRFLNRFPPAYETARNPDWSIPYSFGTFKIPETYVIDRNGKIVQKVISEGSWDDSEATFLKSL